MWGSIQLNKAILAHNHNGTRNIYCTTTIIIIIITQGVHGGGVWAFGVPVVATDRRRKRKCMAVVNYVGVGGLLLQFDFDILSFA